jgi:uncharacterized membrane protein YccC
MSPVLCNELEYVYFALAEERAENERLTFLNQALATDVLALSLDNYEMARRHVRKENELDQTRQALSASSKACLKLKNILERTTTFVNCKNVEHAARASDLRRRITKKRKDAVTGSELQAQEKAKEVGPDLANKKNVMKAVSKISKNMDVASGLVVNGTHRSEALEQDHTFASSSSPYGAEGIDMCIKEDDKNEFHGKHFGMVKNTHTMSV